MRIGIDGRELIEKRTGIGTYIYENIKKLNEIDRENEYYIYSNREVFLDFELHENFHVKVYNPVKANFWLYYKAPKVLKEDKIDLFWGTQHVLPQRNKYTKDIKFVLTIHDLAMKKIKNIGSFTNTIIQKLFLEKSCKNADKIIAVSNSTKKDIVEIFNISEDKIDVAHLGVDSKVIEENLSVEEINELNKKYGIEKGNFLFFLSTIEPRKNIITLVKAYDEYRKNNKDKKLKLVIAGGLGWKYKKILKTIEQCEYTKDIILTGFISKAEKKYFFENCVSFVFPSLYEGFGIPVLEAMKYGALVLTSNISSLPEVGGNAAIYFNDVYDYKELCSKIEEVVSMTDEQKKYYIDLGKEQVKNFTWEKSANETLKVMHKVLNISK